MRKALAVVLLGLLVCGAVMAQDSEAGSDSELERSDSFESASSEAAADSEPAPTPAAPSKRASATLSVSGPLKATVFSADGKRAASREGFLGDTLFKGDKLGTGQSVEVTFTPSGAAKPQQAMLMAASKSHAGLAAYAVAKVAKGSSGSHTVSLSTAAIEKQIANLGGELELTLLLGDPSAPKGLSAVLGTIEVPEGASGAAPKPKLLSAAHQPINNIKPNIAHTFRPPAKRAPAVVSLTFTGLALAPLAGLIIYLLGVLGINFKGLPAGASNLWVLLFHGGIASVLLLYLLFWLRLNLAQTIPTALALGLFTAVTGYYALSALSDERLAAEKAGSPAAVSKKTN